MLDVFESIKDGISRIDPCFFAENNLNLDGEPFRVHSNGYKPFADIYRYIGIKSLEKDAKPVVLVKGRQVGATTMASVLEMYFMASGLFGNVGRPPIRVMHCFPTLVHVFDYSKTKLKAMISQSKLVGDENDPRPGARRPCMELALERGASNLNSLQFKQFKNGNYLRIESTGIDADRLRGGTVDVLLFDEIQDIFKEAVNNAGKLLSQAKWGNSGISVFFGTPKQRGGFYWDIWNMSNQQYYYLGCEKCKKHFPLYTAGSDEWQKIWLYGFIVKCVHCGHEQDKREAAERGKWVPLIPGDTRYIGYHINQLYMPNKTKEKILEQRPEVNPETTERGYQNEVLGEFYRGEAAPITPEEIKEKCGDLKRTFAAQIYSSEKKNVYAGFDWGKKNFSDDKSHGGQSYSSGVVLTEEGPNLLSIQFATLLKRNDIETKKEIVNEMFRQYSVKLAVGDIGYANDLTELLQREHQDRFLASNALAHITNKVKFDSESFPKVIMFERDHYIEELFGLMKKGMIRFPFGNYEKIAWLVSQCSSMEIKTTANVYGDSIIRYVKGSSPNDGFMALLNAYLAYKFDITKGFTNNKAGLFEPPGRKKVSAISVYIPKL